MNATQLLAHFDRLAEAPNAVPRLRRFILDLAVRGKLVEQDTGDEPAVELLKQIQAEKARLATLGLIKREKAAAAIETTAELPPPGWALCRWHSIAKKIGDIDHKMPDTVAGGVPYVSPRDFYPNNVINFEGAKLISREDYLRLAAKIKPDIDDLIYPRYGTIGENRLVTVQREFLASYSCAVVKTLTGFVDPKYQYIFSISGYCKDQAKAAENKNTQANVGIASIQQYIVPLPPLSEQHRIVAKVDELMALCDQLEAAQQERERCRDRLAAASLQRLNQPAVDTTPEAQREHARFHLHHLPRLTTRLEHIKEMRQTIRKLAIAGHITRQDINDEPAGKLLISNLQWRAAAIKRKQIREPRKELLTIGGDDFPYLLPNQWCWARLGEVIYIQSGDGLIAANMKDGSIPVFGGNGVNGHHDASNVDEPTLVIGRVGYYCGSIHITPDRAWVTDNAFVTHFCPDLFSLRFLALLLATTNLKENEGATAQPVISGSKIYPLVVGIPPLVEQHRIVAKVDELMALCDQLEAQLNTTQTDSRRLMEAVLEAALAPA